MNINALVNSEKTGITQKIRPYENDIFKITNRQLEKWRTDGAINTGEMDALYGKINEIVKECYLKEFNLEL